MQLRHASYDQPNLAGHRSLVIGHWSFTTGPSRRSRGAAEIELLLVIPILLTLLFIIKGSFQLGTARLQNVFQAEQKAYADANLPTAPSADSDTGILDPIAGLTAALPALADQLPNRMHVGQAATDVNYTTSIPLPAAHLKELAAFPGPAWSYSAWPVGDTGNAGFDDASATSAWFSDYTAQVRTPAITTALGLSPSSPP